MSDWKRDLKENRLEVLVIAAAVLTLGGIGLWMLLR